MLKWKLLTAASVLVILLCGACGLLFYEPPPKPPMTLFVGVQTVRVEVTNKSTTHRMDTDSLRDALVRAIDAEKGKTRLRATIVGDADCVLILDLLDEDAREVWTDPRQDAEVWQFQAKFYVKLTSKQGQVLWGAPWYTSEKFEFRKIQEKKITPGWSDASLRNFLSSNWASALVYKLVSQ